MRPGFAGCTVKQPDIIRKKDKNMIIMASTIAKAINEVRHITPEELTRDTVKACPDPEIENVNFCKIVYEHDIYKGCIRGDKCRIIYDFKMDIAESKPVHIGKNNTRLFITFIVKSRKTFYELPLSYEYLLTEQGGKIICQSF